MISFLRGQIFERTEDGLILDVNGVGYDLNCSLSTLSAVEGSHDVDLWVHTSVREDAITLFGFSTSLEKRMFLSLLKVNGIGPKMAIKILSGASLTNLAQMIEAGDVKSLSNLPKVGKKTAEQLILTLKGKLVFDAEMPTKKKSSGALEPRFTGARGEILSALVNLGFRLSDAERVVSELSEDIELQTGIRQGLQALSGSF